MWLWSLCFIHRQLQFSLSLSAREIFLINLIISNIVCTAETSPSENEQTYTAMNHHSSPFSLLDFWKAHRLSAFSNRVQFERFTLSLQRRDGTALGHSIPELILTSQVSGMIERNASISCWSFLLFARGSHSFTLPSTHFCPNSQFLFDPIFRFILLNAISGHPT